jgi:hypothetical protein
MIFGPLGMLMLVYLKFMKSQGFSWLGNCIFYLKKYGLMHYVITFAKYKINNLMFMATTLCYIIDCPFETSTCLGRCVFWSHHV